MPRREIFGPTTDYTNAKVVVYGVPFEGTTCFLPGTRFGPDCIRDVSWQIETYSLRHNADVADAGVHDAGNIDIVAGDVVATLLRVRETSREICKDGKIPLMLGGEHSITWGAVMGVLDTLGENARLTVLHFDAHMDLRDKWDNSKWSHACVMRRLLENAGDKIKIIQYGIRSACREEAEFGRECKIPQFFSWDKKPDEAIKLISKNNTPLYISIDIDVLDPAFAPGVGTPEPMGLSLMDLLDVVEPVSKWIIGMDVVEATNDVRTAAVISRLLVELLTAL
ncbi:MAG: agmatinase [Candidatus Korarchaeota archaeon]